MRLIEKTLWLSLLLILLPACAPVKQSEKSPAANRPETFPEVFYQQALVRGEQVYKVTPEWSQVIIRVYKGGKLAGLGHNHVIASYDLHGYLLWNDEETARADIYMPLETLAVDPPDLRARFNMDSTLSDGDIAKTRNNMMTKVLDSASYPFVIVRLTLADPGKKTVNTAASITFNGVTRNSNVLAQWTASDNTLQFIGEFSINQSDYGVKPFEALGGLLRVKDKLDIGFDIQLSEMK